MPANRQLLRRHRQHVQENLEVGATCDTADDNCIDFAVCENNACVAKLGLGETCVVGAALSCLGNLECVGGTCSVDSVDNYCPLGG